MNIDYEIKKTPTDFIVEEVPSFKLQDQGKYIVLKLIKTNRNTEEILQYISKQLHIKRRSIGFAGTKDKHALTTQYISIPNTQRLKQKLKSLQIDNAELLLVGYKDTPIYLGELKQNHFKIRIKPKKLINSYQSIDFVANYFDEQRFSSSNINIGLALLKKQYSKAVELLIKTNQLSLETTTVFKNNPVRLLKTIPLQKLKLFIHSVQSLIFNQALNIYIKTQLKTSIIGSINYSQGEFTFTKNTFKSIKIPLVGFGTNLDDYSKIVQNTVLKSLEQHNLMLRDFIIKPFPEISSFGDSRDMFAEIKKFLFKIKNEFIELDFYLPKSAYATIAIKKFLVKNYG